MNSSIHSADTAASAIAFFDYRALRTFAMLAFFYSTFNHLSTR
jgi:hypothetical protein